jgi:hypothetical protein
MIWEPGNAGERPAERDKTTKTALGIVLITPLAVFVYDWAIVFYKLI